MLLTNGITRGIRKMNPLFKIYFENSKKSNLGQYFVKTFKEIVVATQHTQN